MFKTFKKTMALIMTFVFVLSLMPTFALAEDSVKLEFICPVSIRDHKDYLDEVRDYSAGLRTGTVGNQYKGFIQLDFSGYEHLLRDEASSISVTLGAGTRIAGTTLRMYDCGLFIMDDANDAYGDHYEIYSDAQNGMSSGEVLQYVTPLTTIDGVTPFVSRVDSAAATTYTSDGNKQLILDALDASTDDSVITFQYIQLTSESGASNKLGLSSDSEKTFITINSAGEDATPENYVAYVANNFSWDRFADCPINSVTSELVLPQKFLGADINWSSSNEDAINTETGAVTVNPNANTYVTLTADLTYTSYDGTVATESKEFEVRIPKTLYDYSTGAGTYYNGEPNLFAHSGSSATHIPTYTRVAGVAGKTEADECYEIRDASGNRRYSIPEGSSNILDRDIIEFSVCVPSDAYGFSLVVPMQKDVNDSGDFDSFQSSLTFEHDGIHNSRSEKHILPWDGDQWHHVAIASPYIVSSDASGIVCDKHFTIYVDGVVVYNVEMSAYAAPYGFRYAYLNGLCPLDTYDAETKTFSSYAGYLDDLRWTSDEYNSAYHTKSSVASSYDIDHNAGLFTLTDENVTVKDIADSLTIDEDAVTRFYNEEGELVADEAAVITEDYLLVVADTNGTTAERTFAYYDFRILGDNEYAFDIPYVTEEDGAVEGTVKLFNKTSEDMSYKVYLAVYNDDNVLTAFVPATLSVDSGKTGSITTDAVAFSDGSKAKLLVWEGYNLVPELLEIVYK